MYKVTYILIIILLLTSCSSQETQLNKKENTSNKSIIKAVWIYYDEISFEDEDNLNEERFKSKISDMFLNCSNFGLNTVFVHIRPFADSFYPSKFFPWSKYLTGKQGNGVLFDPLAIMITEAHKYNLSFHAWINPFRVSHKNDFEELSQDNPAIKLKDSDNIFCCDKGIYFNPASFITQKLIIDGVKEIAENYDVDGIHIDDYFYPVTDTMIDKIQYEKYLKNGGDLNLDKWRFETVNAFISRMYSSIKNINKEIILSISPAGNIDNNYKQLYADVKLWSSTEGYCDMIIPQLYFGFNNKYLPFEKAFANWEDMNKNEHIDLICGIGAYKSLESGEDEWKSTDVIRRQTEKALNSTIYDGYALFSYSSLIKLSSDKFSNECSRN